MTPSLFRIALLGLTILATIVGCSGADVIPAQRLTQSNSHVEPEYRIGPGDKLRIFVWRNEDLSAEVVVRPDGKMSMPLVDDMQAEGKTPTDLAADLERTLSDYVRTPKVNVIVESFVGTFGDQIRVVGQAGNPRPVSYRARMTILDVMLEVGGLTDHASGNHAKVMRKIGSKQQGIAVRLNDLLYNGDLSQNIEMLPGDVVVIPTAIF